MKSVVACLVLLFTFVSVSSASNEETLKIGILAYRPKTQATLRWQPLAAYLETALGQSVALQFYGHAGLDAAVARRSVDVVVTSPGQFVLLQHTNGLSAALATLVIGESGYASSAYGGVIVTLAERSDIATLGDLKGKRIAAITPQSFGGYQAQIFEMVEAGVPPPADDRIDFTALPHDRVIDEVLHGRADAGFVRSGVVESLAREGKIDPARLKVINRQNLPGFPHALSTRLYPEWPVAVMPQIDKHHASRIAAALLSMPRRTLGDETDVRGFVIPASYDGIDTLLHRLRLPPFESLPEIRLGDLWRRYAAWILSLAGLMILLLGASTGLVILYRRARRSASAVRQLNIDLEDERRLFIGGPNVAIKWRAVDGWPFEYVSPNVKQQFGYAPDDFISGQVSYTNFIHPDDLSRVIEEVTAHSQDRVPYFEQEYRIHRADGEYRWVYVFTVVMRDEAGKALSYHGHLSDVTERKRMEGALRESEQRFHAIFDQTLQFIGLLSIDGSILQANQAGLRLVGVSEEEVLGKPFWETPWWKHSAELQQRLRKAVKEAAGGKLVRFEATHPSASGDIHYIDFSLKPILDSTGKVVQLLPEGRDITERKLAEQERLNYRQQLEETVRQRTSELLLARDAAEAANKAKSVFLANMSHELRTPLNAILGFSTLLRGDPQLSASHREHLDIINRSGEHLLALINDVLEIAKIEAGRLQLEIKAFDFSGLVREVGEMMELRAMEKGLQLKLEEATNVPRYLKSDKARLRQILINLVGNAVKFTEQGVVTIRYGTRQKEWLHLVIEVEDSGPGISVENRERLFKPFVQLTDSGEQKGTGLGLTITKQFVELMGGDITLESQLGKGSLFRVDLPVEPAEMANFAELETKRHGRVVGLVPGQPDYRILIAEDQNENRILLRQLMSDIGLDVKEAVNGKQCVELFSDWHPDLIWMDRRMPVMDGEEAARRIRRLPGGDKVKIVAVTASAFSEEQQKMLDAGMNELVSKPFRLNEIYDCLSGQLGVRYIYEQEEGGAALSAELTTERLKALPPALRKDLKSVLEDLEPGAIKAVIRRVGKYDAKLEQVLYRIVESYDYPAILKALDGIV